MKTIILDKKKHYECEYIVSLKLIHTFFVFTIIFILKMTALYLAVS